MGFSLSLLFRKEKPIEKPSQLEKQIININPSKSTETILYDGKTGITYQIKYTKKDTLSLIPYDIRGGKK